MYQFTTTNIINSQYALDYEGNRLVNGNGSDIAKYSGSSTAFKVFKTGTFLVDNIVSVYKRPYTAGVKEVASIVVPTTTAGAVYRLQVKLKLSGSTNSEYVNYTTDFRMPINVEITATGTNTTDAAAIVAQLNALKTRFGYAYFKASVSSATITLTANDVYQRFESIVLSVVTANSNSITQYDYITVATGSVGTAGALGFGDDNWMARNIMIQTFENVRPFGMSKDERPVIGGNYTQYTLRYAVDKDGVDGIVAGGKSITTHIFYVLSSLVTSFEAALTAASIAVNTVGTTVTDVSIANATVTAAAGAGAQLVATTTPSGVTNVVYALRSAGNVDASGSGADFTKVSLTPGGLLTFAAGHGIVATDKIGLTVTVDGFVKETTVTMA